MAIFFFVSIELLVSFLHLTPGLGTEIYRWVDEKGIIHFTDNAHSIPEKQRGQATRISVPETPQSRRPSGPPPPEKASIPIRSKGAVIIVQATLNARTPAEFVVDTGAAYTLISRAKAKELDINLDNGNLPNISLQTANGIITAPLVSLDSIEIGGLQVNNLTAAVHDVFSDPEISGLLGLNFLTHFRMDIDTTHHVLHLEKK